MARTNTSSASLLAISTALLFSAGAYGDTPSQSTPIAPAPNASGTTTPERAHAPESVSPSALPNFQLVRFLPRLKFNVGEVRVYKITLKESWQASLTGSQPFGMDVTEAATETVKSVRPKDGAGTVVIQFRSVSLTANGQNYTSDSIVRPFRNERATLTVLPDGKVTSERVEGPDPNPYFALLRMYDKEILSSSADFPKHPVEIGASWSASRANSKWDARTDESATLLDIKDLDGKKVGFFHTAFAANGTGRSTAKHVLNEAFRGNEDGYSDQSFNLNGGYLRGSTGMVHQYGVFNFGLTQRAYENGLVLKANSGVEDSTCYYTVDLVNVIR